MSVRQAASAIEQGLEAATRELVAPVPCKVVSLSGARRLPAAHRPAEPTRSVEQRSELLAERAGRWGRILGDSFSGIASDVEFDLRTRIQAVLTEAERAIDETDPTAGWAGFAGWLDEALVGQVRVNYELAVGLTREVSLRAAEHFGLAESEVVDPPPPTITSDLASGAPVVAAAGGRARGGARMNVFMRAYMGFMIFFLMTRVFGLDLPLYVGALPALVMGAIALREERTRRLDNRKAAAMRTVRHHISDFSAQATKDSRDLVRDLEHGLRDGYHTRVDQLLRAPAWR